MMRAVLLGFGYSARAFAVRFGERFSRLDGTVRDPRALLAKTTHAVALHAFAGGAPSSILASALTQADVIVCSAAPDEAGDPFLPLVKRVDARPRLLQYLSTIGVYGDGGGGWIDEDAPLRATSERGRRRIAAEAAWAEWGAARGVTVQAHRLAGIYGPGRSALDDLAAGTARRLVKPGQVFNRIHADDIAGALMAGVERPDPGAFNVCDDEPAPPQDVVAFAAALIGAAPPPEIPFETAELSPMARSFYGENKRCSNARLKALGWAPLYPTYREGLAALAAASGFSSRSAAAPSS